MEASDKKEAAGWLLTLAELQAMSTLEAAAGLSSRQLISSCAWSWAAAFLVGRTYCRRLHDKSMHDPAITRAAGLAKGQLCCDLLRTPRYRGSEKPDMKSL